MKKVQTNNATLVAVSVAAVFSSSVLALTPPTFTDIDGDGVISEAEVKQIRESHRATMLSEYDVDGDGKLSRMERREAKDARYAQMVQQFDTDGDGELSREERRSARDARRATVEAQFDVNQDGVLSDDERAGLDSVKKHRGRGGKGHRKAARKNRGERNAEEVTGQATE
jgi:hypothetical protein